MWRSLQGCDDLSVAARNPAKDLRCDKTPPTSSAGFCDCRDDVPRHLGCDAEKKPCQFVCQSPPPPVAMASAFEAPPDDSADSEPPEPWWEAHLPAISVSVTFLLVLVVHHLTAPPADERKKFQKHIYEDRRELAFEKSLHAP